jgi:hypothetical protein
LQSIHDPVFLACADLHQRHKSDIGPEVVMFQVYCNLLRLLELFQHLENAFICINESCFRRVNRLIHDRLGFFENSLRVCHADNLVLVRMLISVGTLSVTGTNRAITISVVDILRRASFVGHDIEAFFQRHLGVRLGCKHRLPGLWCKVVGLPFKLKLRLGDVGVSDDLVRRFGFLGLVLLMASFSQRSLLGIRLAYRIRNRGLLSLDKSCILIQRCIGLFE